jgi:activating molecule in BECN1-regulated autophagy protein 1
LLIGIYRSIHHITIQRAPFFGFNMNESSSQYSWDESYMYPFHDYHEPQHSLIDPFSNPLPIPPTDVMNQRWNRRDKILEETKSHLLSHPHDAMADTGRNITIVLSDREQYGASATIGLCRFNRSRQRGCNTSANTPTRHEFYHNSVGDRSPSTVLESPLQRRDTVPSDMDIVTTLDTSILTALGDDQLQPPNHATINNSSDDVQQKRNSTYLRRVTYPLSISREIRTFGEYCTATKYHSAYLTHLGGDDALDADHNLPASSRAVSTISVAFSPDGQTMASTHGDHTVKLSCCTTGRLLQSLEGHPRTPWTVKYHPSDSRILASGCLGHQVRVWNWETNACLQMIRLECAIISLSFHPSGTILAIANGSKLHFWGINDVEPDMRSENGSMASNQQSITGTNQGLGSTRLSAVSAGASRATRLTEMDQRHMLRCVHFPPDGSTLIIGGVNPMTDDSRRPLAGGGAVAGGSMSFYLRLWDFDVEKALDVSSNASFGDPTALDGVGISAARRAISNVSININISSIFRKKMLTFYFSLRP